MDNVTLQSRLTLLIHSCDKYSDLWDIHIFLLNKFWADRKVVTILVTDNETECVFNNVNIISSGKGAEFSQRIATVLPQINSEYILVTLDDYLLNNFVSSEKIAALLDIMDNEKLDYVRLFCDPNSHKKMLGYKKMYKIELDRNYDVNLYQGIWRKSFMEQTVKEPLNAWQYEISLTKIARELGSKCVLSKGREFEILDVVRKGKILHKAARYLYKNNLYHGSREVITWKEELRIFIYATGKKLLPKAIAKHVKCILAKRGHNFYSGDSL